MQLMSKVKTLKEEKICSRVINCYAMPEEVT